MSYVLVSSTTNKQVGGIVIWDSLSGSALASLPGDLVNGNTLSYANDGKLMTAVHKKPLLQYWTKDNPKGTFKKMTTKDIVTATAIEPSGELIFLAIKTNVYIFQASSGCILSILKNGHSATINSLLLVSSNGDSPPFCVSADEDGMICCWDLSCMSQSSALSKVELGSESQISPLWFSVSPSKSCPKLSFIRQNFLLSACSSGLKIYDIFTGKLLSEILKNQSNLLSLASPTSNVTYCGSEGGLIHCIYLEIDQLNNNISHELAKHTCFVGESKDFLEKSVISIVFPPLDKSILAVGSRCGLVEILRNDRFLTRIKMFSVIQPGLCEEVRQKIKLDGLIFIPRPNWLSANQSEKNIKTFKEVNNAETNIFEKGNLDHRKYGTIESIKRRIGWSEDDIFYMKISKAEISANELIDNEEANLYLDDFDRYNKETPKKSDKASLSIKDCFETSFEDKKSKPIEESSDVTEMKDEIEKLKMMNKALLQRVVRAETHFA